MSLESKALMRGVMRIFQLPRLSLSLVIALGATLGAVLCVVAITSALLLNPLPGVSNSEKLHTVKVNFEFGKDSLIPAFTPHVLEHARKHFKDIGPWAGISTENEQLTVDDVSHSITQYSASTNISDVLGTTLLRGAPIDENFESNHIWISNSLWQQAYSGIESIVGTSLTLKGKEYIVAGVLEDLLAIRTERKVLSNQVWLISDYATAEGFGNGRIGGNTLDNVIVKPHQGVGLPTETELRQWLALYIEQEVSNPRMQKFLNSVELEVKVEEFRANFLNDTYQLLIALIVTVIGLLVMASLNLVNLFLTHYQSRNKEFAIQLSVGASQWRMRFLMMLENLPSFFVAGIVGLLLSGWLIKALPIVSDSSLPLLTAIGLDTTTLMVGVLLVISLAILFGMLALVDINKHRLMDNLNSSGKGNAGQNNYWLSRSLMLVQLSIASILMTGSVMLAKQSYDFVYQDIGLEVGNNQQLRFEIIDQALHKSIVDSIKSDGDGYKPLVMELSQAIEQQIPDSKVVHVAPFGPLDGAMRIMTVNSSDNEQQKITFISNHLSADYFDALNIEFLAGSALTQQQIDNKESLVVIDTAMAQTLFSKLSYQEIIGKELPFAGGNEQARTINGVVERVGLQRDQSLPVLYSDDQRLFNQLAFLITKKDGSPVSMAQLRPVFGKLFPRLELIQADSLQGIFLDITASQQLNLWVLIAISILTLVMAAIGVSSLTLMTTHQKKYELAIRMATGASQKSLLRFIINDALWLLTAGLSLGFVLTVFGYDRIKEYLGLLPEFSWLTLGLLDAALVIIVLLSVIIPAWHVIKKDPISALRQD